VSTASNAPRDTGVTRVPCLPPGAANSLRVTEDLGPDPAAYMPDTRAAAAADGRAFNHMRRPDGADTMQANLEARERNVNNARNRRHFPFKNQRQMLFTELTKSGRRTAPGRVWVSEQGGRVPTREPKPEERRKAMIRVQPPVLPPRIKRNMR
jgi:hypothetical protein